MFKKNYGLFYLGSPGEIGAALFPAPVIHQTWKVITGAC